MNGVSSVHVCPPQERTGVIAGTVKAAGLGALGAAGAAAYDSFSLAHAAKTEASGFFANLKQVFSSGEVWKNIGKKVGILAGVFGGLYLVYRGVKAMFSSSEEA